MFCICSKFSSFASPSFVICTSCANPGVRSETTCSMASKARGRFSSQRLKWLWKTWQMKSYPKPNPNQFIKYSSKMKSYPNKNWADYSRCWGNRISQRHCNDWGVERRDIAQRCKFQNQQLYYFAKSEVVIISPNTVLNQRYYVINILCMI